MFGKGELSFSVEKGANAHIEKTFGNGENRKSPKKYERLHAGTKKGRIAGMRPVWDDAYFLLPRMVASGLVACFMNALGLMPTMFLNCLEK